jgi:hypothetical protein
MGSSLLQKYRVQDGNRTSFQMIIVAVDYKTDKKTGTTGTKRSFISILF